MREYFCLIKLKQNVVFPTRGGPDTTIPNGAFILASKMSNVSAMVLDKFSRVTSYLINIVQFGDVTFDVIYKLDN